MSVCISGGNLPTLYHVNGKTRVKSYQCLRCTEGQRRKPCLITHTRAAHLKGDATVYLSWQFRQQFFSYAKHEDENYEPQLLTRSDVLDLEGGNAEQVIFHQHVFYRIPLPLIEKLKTINKSMNPQRLFHHISLSFIGNTLTVKSHSFCQSHH